MKNKTLGLLVLVMVIWSAIGYQIYQHFSEQEPVAGYRRKSKVIAPVDSIEKYQLYLNYPDPFLKKTIAGRSIITTAKIVTKKRPVNVPQPQVLTAIAWETIEYLGSMNNTTRSYGVAMVRINGVDYTFRQGEVLNGFQILEIRKDSVEVINGNQKKYIKKRK